MCVQPESYSCPEPSLSQTKPDAGGTPVLPEDLAQHRYTVSMSLRTSTPSSTELARDHTLQGNALQSSATHNALGRVGPPRV